MPRKPPVPVEVRETEKPKFVTIPPKQDVRRVTPADVDAIAPWFAPILQEYYGAPLGTILRWMRTWSMENQYNFIQTAHGAGVAQAVNDPLSPYPRVEEIFMAIQPGYDVEGFSIYAHWAGWGKTIGADEFRWNYILNAPLQELRTLFPNMQKRQVWFVEL